MKLIHTFPNGEKEVEMEDVLESFFEVGDYIEFQDKDYLTDGLRDILNAIEHRVIASEYKNYHTTLELDFNSKFYEIQNMASEDKRVWQEKKQKSNELLRKKDNTNLVAGYVNAFTVLLTVLFFGIIMSITLLIFMSNP